MPEWNLTGDATFTWPESGTDNPHLPYESVYERFEATGPDGGQHYAEFRKAGFLAVGEQPELYFYAVDGQEAVVGISGDALKQFQRRRRYLSREEKIDLAGLLLKRAIEAGAPLVSEYLYIRDKQLETLAGDLGLTA